MTYYFSLFRRQLTAALTGLLLAIPSVVYPFEGDEEWRFPFDGEKQQADWQEQAAELPAFPSPAQLTELPQQPADAALTILMDIDSVAVGEDGVVRYTLALRSRTGAQNIFYEGIRCGTREWKTYAYGRDGSWRENQTDWQPLTRMGAGAYRHALYDHYLCERFGSRLENKEIKRRLRYGRETDKD